MSCEVYHGWRVGVGDGPRGSVSGWLSSTAHREATSEWHDGTRGAERSRFTSVAVNDDEVTNTPGEY
jgi:hypothetical protein